MKFIYDGGKQNLLKLLDQNKMRGIKIIDSSKPQETDSSSDDETKLVVENDISYLDSKVTELLDKQKAKSEEISPKWKSILQTARIADKNGRIIDSEKF